MNIDNPHLWRGSDKFNSNFLFYIYYVCFKPIGCVFGCVSEPRYSTFRLNHLKNRLELLIYKSIHKNKLGIIELRDQFQIENRTKTNGTIAICFL